MAQRRGEAGPEAANLAGRPEASPGADRERLILLECRIDELRSQVEAARAEADLARTRLAEAAAREARHVAKYGQAYAELADARAEAAALHRSLERSEGLRASLEGHLLDAGPRDDARELLALRREVIAERQRANLAEETAVRLRDRAEELLSSREILFARLAEWQELIREDGSEAADLSEYLAELRREILDLERDRRAGRLREGILRDRLARAGVDPDVVPADGIEHPLPSLPEAMVEAVTAPIPEAASVEATAPVASNDPVAAALAAGDIAGLRAALLRVGQRGRTELARTLAAGLESADPSMRAAVYEALRKVLDGEPAALETHLRAGLRDADARVRRRVVLAAATARGVALHSLLEPLRADPDAQVQRVVREALRHAPTVGGPGPADDDVVLTGTDPNP